MSAYDVLEASFTSMVLDSLPHIEMACMALWFRKMYVLWVPTMSELVEWLVGYKDEQGKVQFITAGAQSIFSQTTGEKLAKKLGPEYGLWNWRTLKPLNEAKEA